MSPNKPDDTPNVPLRVVNDQQRREWCIDYLLGELSQSQQEAFEQQLVHDDWSATLLRESELLCVVAEQVDCTPPRQHAVPNSSVAELGFAATTTSPNATASPRALLAVVVALAATILFAFGVSKLTDPPRVSSEMPLPANGISPTEKNEPLDLAIARSLVDPALQWDSNNDSILSELDTVNEPIEDWIADSPDSDESFESTIESDETLAWMVAAVKASDQSAEGTRADTQHDG